MFEQIGDKEAGSGIWNLRPLLGAIICNRILITLADRLGSGCFWQYLPYTIQIQPVTSTSLINGYQRILWFYTGKKKNSSLLPQIPSLRSTPFSHPLSCSSSSFIPWLSHYDMRCGGDRWKGVFSAFFEQQNVALSRNKLVLSEILSYICMCIWFLVVFYKFVMEFL